MPDPSPTGSGPNARSANPWHDRWVVDGGLAEELAERLAELARLSVAGLTSPPRILRHAVDLAARAAPGASAASTAVWRRRPGEGWEPELYAASHPDTAWLDEEELAVGAGPALAALAADGPVDVPDLLADPPFPALATAAVASGVRALRTLVRPLPAGRLTLTLHAVRPGALGPDDTTVATLVLAQTATALGNAEQYGEVRRSAHQLTEAMRTRSVIEQAKGVLMHALGCDADAAFAELRRRSQAANVRLAEIAARVVGDPLNATADPAVHPDGPPLPRAGGGGVRAGGRGYRSRL